MHMRKLLDIVSGNIKKKPLVESTNECGEMPMVHSQPMSMNVNLNAQGVDQIKDLLSLIAQPVRSNDAAQAVSHNIVMDLDPLDDIVKNAGLDRVQGTDDTNDCDSQHIFLDKKESYANEPDEQISDIDDVIINGDDLHRKKKMYKATQPGDNPMAVDRIKESLQQHYAQIKSRSIRELSSDLKTSCGSSKGKSVTEDSELGQVPERNFTIDDIKQLEKITDLDTLKAKAVELISTRSARPMKPAKVQWFDRVIHDKNSHAAVIKVMYDLMLSGEGLGVIGSGAGTSPNPYRRKFKDTPGTSVS